MRARSAVAMSACGAAFVDKITTSVLETFSKENGITLLPEEVRFEHLTAYLAIRRHFSRALDTEDVIVGAGGDTGLDAIAIIVNGALMTDVDHVQEMYDQNNYIEATFIFIQAERSAGFDGAKIGTIGNGVVDFFADHPKMDRNDKVKESAEIMRAVYNLSAAFRKRPACRIYYVTTGAWNDDTNLVARRDAVFADLKSTEMFSDIEFRCLGAADIHRMYQATKNAVRRTFVFGEKVEIPAIPGVELAFLGYIPATTFVTIIGDEAGDDILGSIFYDNVRDWQDYSEVNNAMRNTIHSDRQTRFVLMNNGVTIIAKDLKQAGSNFTIENFQIVNGCQTSNVISDQRDKLRDSMMVPLRLICSTDDDVIESIVFATNQQTELKPEQLYARTDFAKTLERFFATTKDSNQLYYERRDGQYDRLPVEKGRIVPPQTAIKTFAAMFLGEPHTTAKNYKLLRARIGTEIFVKGHKLEPYYVAALTAYRLELQYRSQKISAPYKSARYHVLLAMRLLMDPAPLPPMNSKEIEKRCDAMIATLSDPATVDKLFQKAVQVIDKVSNGDLSRDNIRTQTMTAKILAMLGKSPYGEEDGRRGSLKRNPGMTHGASGFSGPPEMEGCAGLDGRLRVVKIAQTVFSD
jgi:hypothetical protein